MCRSCETRFRSFDGSELSTPTSTSTEETTQLLCATSLLEEQPTHGSQQLTLQTAKSCRGVSRRSTAPSLRVRRQSRRIQRERTSSPSLRFRPTSVPHASIHFRRTSSIHCLLRHLRR